MNKIYENYRKLYNPWVIQAGRIAFYLGLLFEVIIFTLDRADWINPYQSMMFRATFVLFVFKCICTRYDKKQMLFILATAALSIITYVLSGKDEAIRAMVFIIAMKDMSLHRTLKLDYMLMSAATALLGILAVFGIMGEVIASPGYAEKADAFMVAFGLGSSNTWAIQIWVLTALMVYLFHDRWNKWAYLIIGIGGITVYALSKTSTALIMFMFTALGGFVLSTCKKINKSRIVYLLGGIVVLLCTAFSVMAAKISKWWDFQPEWQRKLDTVLTGRITSIYAFENGGGVLKNWKLFGGRDFTQSFDMGIVRMFWWYGIIPGALAIAAILCLIYIQYKRNDYMGFLLLLSMVIFSVFEAHFISVFIARCYLLFMFGDTWHIYIKDRGEEKPLHIAFYIGSLNKGGAERVFCNLAEYFAMAGWKVTIITQYKKETEYDLPAGCERIISDIDPDASSGRMGSFVKRVFKLHHILVRTGADIMLTTIGKNNFMAICAAVFLPVKVVVSVVADPAQEYPGRSMRFILQLLFPEADGIVMQTTESVKFLKLGLDKKSVILPNSVSPVFIRERYTGERDRNIYVVGRLDANKNQEMAIRAFASIAEDYPDTKLILMGQGELREKYEELAGALGLEERVIFTGLVEDVPERLWKAYIFLLTSYTEGMPNTLLEAMTLGTACISTDCPCGGPRDIITPDKDGILIPVGDTDALTTQLKRLLDNPYFTEELGAAAYKTMEAYHPAAVNARWEAYFRGILGN